MTSDDRAIAWARIDLAYSTYQRTGSAVALAVIAECRRALGVAPSEV